MNVLGIIAEYNPLHNGHIYHMEEAKKRTNADYIIVIMSGSFTQQGNIGILNKFERAELAIKAGADMVIELPTIYATSSSENFCKGAVNILNSLGCVTHIAFGCECTDLQTLKNIASKMLLQNDTVIEKISENMKDGTSCVKSASKVLKEILTAEEYMQVDKPNNILAIEYIKSLIALESKIRPVLIERATCQHGNSKIENWSDFASSSGIRTEICSNSNYLDNIKKVIPETTYNLLSTNRPKTNDNIYDLLKYKILSLGKCGLMDIKEISEGLENRFYEMALKSNSYEELIFNVKCKRYTLSRIKRICINILLGITKDKDFILNNVQYARILKINNKSTKLLTILSKSRIPIITTLKDPALEKLNNKILESLYLDILATNIANISDTSNIDYTNNIIIHEKARK